MSQGAESVTKEEVAAVDGSEEVAVVGDVSDCPPIASVSYEYLDHTADVQIHSWGDDIQQAMEQCGMGMFGYMTDIEDVNVEYTFDIKASGDDMESLLFHFLDEWLYAFSVEPFFIPRIIKVLSFDAEKFELTARGWGESFDIATKHSQGTEVKAITYSNMQIHQKPDRTDIYVIIDI